MKTNKGVSKRKGENPEKVQENPEITKEYYKIKRFSKERKGSIWILKINPTVQVQSEQLRIKQIMKYPIKEEEHQFIIKEKHIPVLAINIISSVSHIS